MMAVRHMCMQTNMRAADAPLVTLHACFGLHRQLMVAANSGCQQSTYATLLFQCNITRRLFAQLFPCQTSQTAPW